MPIKQGIYVAHFVYFYAAYDCISYVVGDSAEIHTRLLIFSVVFVYLFHFDHVIPNAGHIFIVFLNLK